MTALGNDEYELDLDTDEDDSDLAIIFTDGTKQTPAANEAGFTFTADATYDQNGVVRKQHIKQFVSRYQQFIKQLGCNCYRNQR